MRYVLGIDGGGTKTDCALYDIDTGRLDMLTCGPSNHEGMAEGIAALPEVFAGMFRSMLARNNIEISDIEMAVLGLAGVDTAEQHRIISGILTGLGLKKFVLCNDSYLGIKSGSPSGTGICAISGTGSSVTGIDSTGKQLQVGGLGEWSGDLGGGILVRRSVGLVYNQLFREGPYTELTTAIFRWLNITDKNDFVDILTGRFNSDYKSTILALSLILHRTAAEGDAEALRYLEMSGLNYAGGIAGLIGDLSFAQNEEIYIVFAGSLFTKSDCSHAQKTAEKFLTERFPDRRLVFRTLDVSCSAGAILWALDELGAGNQREAALRKFKGGIYMSGSPL
jgi:N-acetylglucosamine kinase-like BadF-type ATPase